MSIITRTPKKLTQSALSNVATAYYTTSADTTTQVTEIWLVNTNASTARTVTMYTHGLTSTNITAIITIQPNTTALFGNSRIVLTETETLGFKQDTGTDVIASVYGIEEVTS
jgi:hypothetical protein